MKLINYFFTITFILVIFTMAIPSNASVNKFNSVSAGYTHSVAIDENGTVWAWGFNQRGECGYNNSIYHPYVYVPSKINITNVTQLSLGMCFTIALKSDGTVWALGKNDYGQLGLGSSDEDVHFIPSRIPGLNNITSVSAGPDYSLALKDDGTVWSWGHNDICQLGDGEPSRDLFTDNASKKAFYYYMNRSYPDKVYGLNHVRLIYADVDYAFAIDDEGSIWAWGHYVLNSDDLNGNATPRIVGHLKNVKAIIRGGQFLTGDDKLYTLKFVQGYDNKKSLMMVKTMQLSNVSAIGSGEYHTVVLLNNGTVWAWGSNTRGELGDGSNLSSPNPVLVPGLKDIINISAGGSYTIALEQNGMIWGWGMDDTSQLGDNNTNYTPYRSKPVKASTINYENIMSYNSSGKATNFLDGIIDLSKVIGLLILVIVCLAIYTIYIKKH